MIKATLRSRLFLHIWLWALAVGVVGGIVLTLLIGLVTGNLSSDPSNDSTDYGFLAAILLLGIGNLLSYVTAIVVGNQYVRSHHQGTKLYLAKCVPLSLLAIFLSFSILFPLLLVGSLIAAFIVTFSIRQVLPELSAPKTAPAK